MKCGQKWSWEAVLEGLAECLPALAQRGGRVPTRLRRWLTAFPLPHCRMRAPKRGKIFPVFSFRQSVVCLRTACVYLR